ncbi:hypothetical protein ACTFIY_000956 [Dictyostelium cf. discoideum]
MSITYKKDEKDLKNNTNNSKKKYIAKEFQSLLCVFTALRGTQITIQLRSNCEIYGTITNVDAYLNIELSDAKLTNRYKNKRDEHVQEILIQSRNIRFIQIPDKIDLNSLLYLYSKQLSQSKKKYERTLRKPPPPTTN